MDLNSLFPNVTMVPGGGFIEQRAGQPQAALGDEASVMMISGLGQEARASKASNLDVAGKPITQAAFHLPNVKTLLAAKVRVGAYEVPVWVLALVLSGALGAVGWWLFVGRKK